MRRKTVQSGSTEDFYCKKKKSRKTGERGREGKQGQGRSGQCAEPERGRAAPTCWGAPAASPGHLCVGCEVENKVIG